MSLGMGLGFRLAYTNISFDLHIVSYHRLALRLRDKRKSIRYTQSTSCMTIVLLLEYLAFTSSAVPLEILIRIYLSICTSSHGMSPVGRVSVMRELAVRDSWRWMSVCWLHGVFVPSSL